MTATAIRSPYCDTEIRTEADAGETAEVIAGLRAFADRLEAALNASPDDPDMAVHKWGVRVLYGPRDGVAGVRRRAARLGIKAGRRGPQYEAVLPFGPGVSYVLHASAAELQAHNAAPGGAGSGETK